ncbi:MAG TPA: molybdate ABC transporter substrate-binding protein [Pseudolabrys sp.]|nr:molybdate ABC transporter substrate-binding protein [Pseudolabrys sp.]
MRTSTFAMSAKLALVLLFAQGVTAKANEVKVIAGAAFAPALSELGPQFERTTGDKLIVEYGITGTLKRQMESGEAFDLAIIPEGLIDAAVKQGKIAAGTRHEIARVGMAVAARAGAPRPDISSVDAFKRALLDAKSIAYPPQGAVGIHLAKVFERLGIAEQMQSKIKPQKSVGAVPKAVAAGEAELGFAPSTVFQNKKDIEMVGAYPSELQHYIVYASGISGSASRPDDAKALLKYLMSPGSIAVIKAKGLESLVTAN